MRHRQPNRPRRAIAAAFRHERRRSIEYLERGVQRKAKEAPSGVRGERPTALNRFTMRQVPALRKPYARVLLVIVVFAPIARHCLAPSPPPPSLRAAEIRHRVILLFLTGLRFLASFRHPRKTRTFELSRPFVPKCVEEAGVAWERKHGAFHRHSLTAPRVYVWRLIYVVDVLNRRESFEMQMIKISGHRLTNVLHINNYYPLDSQFQHETGIA